MTSYMSSKRPLLIPTLILLILASRALFAQPGQAVVDTPVVMMIDDPDSILKRNDLTVVPIPIPKTMITYVNKTETVTKKEFPDSFFIDATNDLITYECSNHFTVNNYFEKQVAMKDSTARFGKIHYSILKNDTVFRDSMAQFIRTVAAIFQADLVVYPYRCVLQNIIYQQKGWRGGNSNTSRPVKYQAFTSIHLQIWDATGKLKYERIASNRTPRPILYTLFRKRSVKNDEGFSGFSKHYFAPPLIRSLSESIADAMSGVAATQQ